MLEEWSQEEEAKRLHQRFDTLKAEQGIGQAEFARTFDLPGGASMLSQHIKGRRPMNLEAALVYAHGFNVPLAEISPRLAAEVARAVSTQSPAVETHGTVQESVGVAYLAKARQERWPFPRVDFEKLVSLQGVDARNLENALLAAAGDLDLDIRVARSGKIRHA